MTSSIEKLDNDMSQEKNSTDTDSINSYHGFQNDPDIEDNTLEMVNSIHYSVQQDQENNVLNRLQTLSKQVSHLSALEMKSFVVDKNDFDLNRILNYLKRKSNEQGLVDKFTGVEFEDVTVLGVDDSLSVVQTVADVFGAPYLVPKRLIFGDKNKPIKKKGDDRLRRIISNVNVNVNAGEMCLVLGRPGSGCSSFLRTIAGETGDFVRVDGDISYNNIPQKEMLAHFRRELIYNPELDVHFPHLTVDKTLRFAIGCRTPLIRFDNISRSEYVYALRDLWATVFGLTHTYNTKVGNDFVRGVSGGERKRVSIAEASVAQGSVYAWDNATRGLDASTALEYAELIRTSTNLLRTASFVTIYQAGENIYECFDKVTVLYQGRQIYFGPAANAKKFFVDMGYECPPRQDTAEFLTSVTDPIGRRARPGFENKVPKTPDEFELYWRNSAEFAQLKQDLQKKKQEISAESTKLAFLKNMEQEKLKYSRKQSRYTINFFQQMKLCTIRGLQNIMGDKAYLITMALSAFVQLLIIGSLFYQIPNSTDGAFGRGGTLFFSILYFSLMALAEVAAVFAERPILLKQKGYSFYHPSANVLSATFTQLPLKMVCILLYSIPLYFLANLKVDLGAFFTFVLFIFITSQVISALFQMISAFLPSLAAANGLTGICMLCCNIYSSYMIQRPSMVPWFKWFSYMNPILFGFELMITTDFHGRRMECDNLVPTGPGYENITSENQVCGYTASNGQIYVDGDFYLESTFGYKFWHVWRNFGILFCFWFGFLALNCFASEKVTRLKGGGDHLSFIRGAKISDSIVGPESALPSAEDPELGDVEKTNIADDIDNNRGHLDVPELTTLGSDEIFMWQHVDYVIPYKGGKRKLLDDVQGYIKPGSLTALMGESGAGKTTLLNVLSQRIDVGVITGDMLVDGKPLTSSFKRRTGYVQQQDVHIAELTVRESLQFAARMRRPLSVPDEEKLAYVEEVIRVLQMEDYADAQAGDPGTGLNVEQRKKLSIATEMVAKPELLLFLDEPTSGLDSQSAWSIVSIMRDLAQAGQAILCTIHQPSATLFEAFDRLLMLRKGGQTVYFGDIGENSRTILDYFESNGAGTCKPSENPAEYILELIGAGATASTDEDWFEKWTSSAEYAKVTQDIATMIAETSQKPVKAQDKEMSGTYATPYLYQLKLVTIRTYTQFFRDLDYVMSKFMLMTLAGLIIGFSYWNIKHTVVGMQNAMFANFISMVLSAPLANQIQGRAIQSRDLYEVRESKSNTFHWSTLLLAQFFTEMPYSVVFSTIYFICLYFPIQMNNGASRLGVWWMDYCIFFQLYYVSFSLWIVYMSPDLPSANVIISFLFNFIFSFTGVVQPVGDMPGFWTFMFKVSPFTYFAEDLTSNLLHGREVHCGPIELSTLAPPEGLTCDEYLNPFLEHNSGYVTTISDTECGYCQYAVGEDFLETIDYKWSHRWRNIGFYFVYLLFNIAAMLSTFWLFRVNKVSLIGLIKKLVPKKKTE